ncbi:MAG: hypothetical protein WKG07_32175 [Hymenobacter sp.]
MKQTPACHPTACWPSPKPKAPRCGNPGPGLRRQLPRLHHWRPPASASI